LLDHDSKKKNIERSFRVERGKEEGRKKGFCVEKQFGNADDERRESVKELMD
jgi:hypothetical protein